MGLVSVGTRGHENPDIKPAFSQGTEVMREIIIPPEEQFDHKVPYVPRDAKQPEPLA